ncbi:hypothetical protein HK105_206153 [Polyrhizophydium stewartii]|uniref:protein-serine/threonine phosphatase n=1 Tax=Polyrhizophydium stewartii TaxID=2732419 RepID=A0ABR4N4B8_9FUNG
MSGTTAPPGDPTRAAGSVVTSPFAEATVLPAGQEPRTAASHPSIGEAASPATGSLAAAAVAQVADDDNSRDARNNSGGAGAGAKADGEPTLRLLATWNGGRYSMQVPASTTMGQLKRLLEDETHVHPTRQKLLGLVKGKLPADDVPLRSLELKDPHPFIMMGTVESSIPRSTAAPATPAAAASAPESSLPEALNDAQRDPANKQALAATHIRIINEPRPNRRLLVLDLDYTLFDCKTPSNNIMDLARPGLHEFLAAVYPYYDICVWSQTSWRWVEAKITELGMLLHSKYKIAFVLDETSMFSITSMARTTRDGRPARHMVKPLELIWSKFPDRFSAKNTIHIDDLSRNFVLNLQSGLEISPFRNGPASQATDRELYALSRYLLLLVIVPDFRTLDHKQWKTFGNPLPK